MFWNTLLDDNHATAFYFLGEPVMMGLEVGEEEGDGRLCVVGLGKPAELVDGLMAVLAAEDDVAESAEEVFQVGAEGDL